MANWGEIFVIIFLLAVAIILTILAISYHGSLEFCETNESPYCMEYVCKCASNKSCKPDPICGKHAFRFKDGKKICSGGHNTGTDS